MVCIRWAAKDIEVEEDFISLVPLERAQANVIAAAIKDVLMRLSLPISNAKAQCYDGFSTMVGSKKGVATIIKQSQLNCMLIHCYCHTLNLAVGDVIKNIPALKESLEDVYEFIKLIKYSPKHQAALQRKQKELKIDNLHLTVNTSEQMVSDNYSKIGLLCQTRWTVRAEALHSKHNNQSNPIQYKPIQEWLTWCVDKKNNSDLDSYARAGGLLKRMKSFKFMYGLKLSMMVLDHKGNLIATLQTKNLCVADAQETARLVVDTITKMLNKQDATSFYEIVKIRAD